MRRAAALCLVAACTPAMADGDGTSSPLAFVRENAAPQAASQPESGAAPVTTAAPAGIVQGNVHRLQRVNAGGLTRQTASVAAGCLKPDLLAVLRRASDHFGSEAVVTSGFRRGRGFHARCMAADVQIAGVAPGALARWFRTQSDVGGVGTYGHTRSVHVDVAPRKYVWHGRSSRRIRFASAG
jgi:hypothetical protein